MPTNLEYRKRGRQRKRDSRATEKELEQERKNKGDIFGWGKNMTFCSCGEKMKNACVHQGENEGHEKKSVHGHIRHFLHKMGNQEVSGSFNL